MFGFLFFWQVSQALDLKTLGEYIYLTAALGYFGSLIDYGFNLFVLNTASRSAGSVRSLFLRVILSKLILTVLSMLILAGIYSFAFDEQGLFVTSLFFLLIALQSFSGLMLQFFKAMGRFEHELSSTIIANLVPVLILFMFFDNLTLLELAWLVVSVRLAVLLFQVTIFQRITQGQNWAGADEMAVNRFPRAIRDIQINSTYAIFSILGAVFLSVDLVIMRFTLGPEDISLYGTAMKIILAGILFFEVLNGTFTPRLARLHSERSENFSYEVRRFFAIMISTSIIFSLLVFSFGPIFIVWAFGPEFEDAGLLVRVLSFVLMLRVAEMTTGPLLTIYGKQAFRARIMAVVLPVHLGLNLVLQPQFGVWGAVVSLTFSFLLLFLLNGFYLLRTRRALLC